MAAATLTESSILMGNVIVGLVLATALAYGLHRLRLPPVVAYMLAGALIGPSALGLIHSQEDIAAVAQLGVSLLLFTVGLELSPGKLRKMREYALRVGTAYMGLGTVLVAGALRWLWDAPWSLALLLGGTLSLSSTAIVLKSLEDNQELETTHGRISLGTLIIQDLLVVPLIALLPLLAHTTSVGSGPASLWQAMAPVLWGTLKAIVLLSAVVGVCFQVVPRLLDRLAQTRSRELFTLSIVSLALGVAVLAQLVGLSLEAGAFIAGLSLSGSIYSRQVVADSRPLRDIFATLFFLSVGLVWQNTLFLKQWLLITGLVLGIMVLKTGVGLLAVWFTRDQMNQAQRVRTGLWTGLLLCQSGEFAFLLLNQLMTLKGLSAPVGQWLGTYGQPLVHAVVLSMFVTPLIARVLPALFFRFWPHGSGTGRLSRYPTANHAGVDGSENATAATDVVPLPQGGHVVVAGYGPIGQQVVQALQLRWLEPVVVDTNPTTIKRLQAEGIASVFGDITRPEVQQAAGLDRARSLVLALPDSRLSAEAARLARQLNPELHVLSRVRFASEIERAKEAGVCQVVHEEEETALRLVLLTLMSMGVSGEEAQAARLLVREQWQNRPVTERRGLLSEPESIFGRLTLLAGTQVEWFELGEDTPLIGHTLATAQIRQKTGATVIGVVCGASGQRQEATPECALKHRDVLIAVGSPEQLDALEHLLQHPMPTENDALAQAPVGA